MRGAAPPGQAQDGIRAGRPIWAGVHNATGVVTASIFETPDPSPCASTGSIAHYILGVVGLERSHALALNSEFDK